MIKGIQVLTCTPFIILRMLQEVPILNQATRSRDKPLEHPTGCHSDSPWSEGANAPERPAGNRHGNVIDPCGRTSLCRCDHKGRWIWGNRNPPVFGSASLDRGLAEWHPSGAPLGRPTRPR